MKGIASLLLTALAAVTIPPAMAQLTTIETTVSSPTTTTFALPSSTSYIVVNPLTGKLVGDYSASVRVPAGYYVAERTTGKVVATTTAAGTLVSVATAPAPNTLVQIEERTSALQRLVDEAIAKNTVTVTEVAPIRTALADIAAQQVILRQAGTPVTFAQTAPLAYRLNVLGTQLVPMVRSTVSYKPILGDRFFVEGGQVIYAPTDYAARRALIDQRIQLEYDAGRLTNRQVKDLRTDLTRVATLELKRKRDGSLSSSNMRSIERKLNDLSEDLQEDIAFTNRRRANIGLKVD